MRPNGPRTNAGRRAGRVPARLAGFVLAAVLALTTLLPAGPALAAQTDRFGAEPYPLFEDGEPRRFFELDLAPGGRWSDAVRVWNRTEERIELRVYGAGAENADGHYQVAAYEGREEGVGAWVRTSEEVVALAPGEERIVEVSVTAPAALPEEEYLAAVVVEGPAGVSAGGVDVVTRLATLLVIARDGGLPFGASWLLLLAALLVAALLGAHAVRRERARRRRRARARATTSPQLPAPVGAG